MMKARPYILAETNWKTIQETDFELAVLPWGATEAHNYHLPYATDNYQVEAIGRASTRLAWEKGAKVILLPNIPFGINTGQLDIKLCMNMNPSTQYAILRDVVDVLQRHGIYKLVILNGHGGNDFKSMIRELSFEFPQVFVCSLNWYRVGNSGDFFDDPGDHGGEMETSLMMHLHPELVRPLEEAGPGTGKSLKLKGFREGWAISQRQWRLATADTGVGNPYPSTPEKGRRYLKMITTEICNFLVELASTTVEDLYA